MSTSQPLEIAPVVTTTPPTTTIAVPHTVPAIGASTTDTSVATTTILDPNMSMEGMMKGIKELELQMEELKETKEKLARIEVSYDIYKVIVVEKKP